MRIDRKGTQAFAIQTNYTGDYGFKTQKAAV